MGKLGFRRALLFLVVAALVAAAPSAEASRGRQVKVMTWNVFADIDLGPLIVTPPGPQFDQLGSSIFSGLEARDPNGRMKLIADEIARVKPDVVGLQEVPLWRTGSPPASTVAFDFLGTIRTELARKHASYRVAAVKQPFDLEFPTDRGFDVRITFGDAMLIKRGVKARRVHSRVLRTEQAVQTQAIGVMHRPRVWNEFDATVRGVSFHIVNTHLEPRDPNIRRAQASELVKGPLHSRLPTILLGDLNSSPTRPEVEQRKAYQVLARAGFKEVGVRKFTCCFLDLAGDSGLDDAPDHIMARPKPKVVRSFLVGSERTSTGFHPSDHEAVVAVLVLRRARGQK